MAHAKGLENMRLQIVSVGLPAFPGNQFSQQAITYVGVSHQVLRRPNGVLIVHGCNGPGLVRRIGGEKAIEQVAGQARRVRKHVFDIHGLGTAIFPAFYAEIGQMGSQPVIDVQLSCLLQLQYRQGCKRFCDRPYPVQGVLVGGEVALAVGKAIAGGVHNLSIINDGNTRTNHCSGFQHSLEVVVDSRFGVFADLIVGLSCSGNLKGQDKQQKANIFQARHLGKGLVF